MMPVHVVVKEPAESPYMTQDIYSTVRLTANPHRRNVPTVAPTVQASIHIVTCRRSIGKPSPTQPATEDTLTSRAIKADGNGPALSASAAYEGR